METFESILYAICLGSISVILIAMTLAVVGLVVGLVVQEFKHWREEDG